MDVLKGVSVVLLLWLSTGASVAIASSTKLLPIYGPYPDNQPVAIDGAIYFSAHTEQSGAELWVANANSSRQLVDVIPGPEGSHPDDFVKFRRQIYFSAKDNTFGRQLWRLTDVGAERVTGRKPGDSLVPQFPVVFNDALYFRGRAEDTAFALWRFDEAKLARIGSVGVFSRLVPFNGLLYFGGVSNERGLELYRSDGQTADMAFDIAPGRHQHSWPSMLGEYRGWLYFSACESGHLLGCRSERLLFRTDGRALEKVPGPSPMQYSPHLTALGKLYFWEVRHHFAARQLCEFDGTRCRRIATVAPGETAGPVVISDSLYFVDRNPSGGGEQRNCLIRYRDGSFETVSHTYLKGWSIGYLVSASGIGFLRAWDASALRIWRIQPSP